MCMSTWTMFPIRNASFLRALGAMMRNAISAQVRPRPPTGAEALSNAKPFRSRSLFIVIEDQCGQQEPRFENDVTDSNPNGCAISFAAEAPDEAEARFWLRCVRS